MKRVLLLVCTSVAFTIMFCSAPGKELSQTLSGKKQIGNDYIPKGDSTIYKDSYLEPLESIPVERWIGMSFLVLEKQKMFCKNGYELYYADMENSQLINSSDLINPQLRVSCDELRGHSLIVQKVLPDSGEWIVLFLDKATNKGIAGKTYKQCIKEIVAENDIDRAKKYWQNKFVFSRKGVISTYSEETNCFGSQKVKIDDSLLVIDVVAGLSPLPVNPIWLMVKTHQGLQGVIPVRSSWTNVMTDMVKDAKPWDAEVLENDPAKMYSWDEDMWQTINNHRVVLEMSMEQVLLSWGEPLQKESKAYNGKSVQCWRYAAQMLYFDDNKLIEIENSQ